MEKRELNLALNSILKIPHGKLTAFGSVEPFAASEPTLFGRFVSWNEQHSRVRDSKIALPLIALRTTKEPDLIENALANLALLGPRELERAVRTHYEWKSPKQKALLRMVRGYLNVRECSREWWDRAAIRGRSSMKSLYALSHKKPSLRAQRILFDNEMPENSVWSAVRDLAKLPEKEAASLILKFKIPFTVAIGAGVKLDDPATLLAVIEGMTPNEIVIAAGQISKLKAAQTGAVRDALREATAKAATDKRVNIGRVDRVKKNIKSEELQKTVAKIKEKGTETLAKIEGSWVVLVDRSGSMEQAIERGAELASILAKQVQGKLFLVYFNERPLLFDVPKDATLEAIQKTTRGMLASGRTSIGCGLAYLRAHKETFDGIVLLSDGLENAYPSFASEYKKIENEPALYFIEFPTHFGYEGLFATSLEREGIQFERFVAKSDFDYYSMVNVASVLKPTRYAFVEEIEKTPLRTLAEVLKLDRKEVRT